MKQLYYVVDNIIEDEYRTSKGYSLYIIVDNQPTHIFSETIEIEDSCWDDIYQILVAELYKDVDSEFYSDTLIKYLGDTKLENIRIEQL